MKKLLLVLLVSAPAMAGTAYFSHETSGTGMTKQCHYEYMGERYSITIAKVRLCPLTIQV